MTRDTTSRRNASSPTDPGPSVLRERSLIGIFVHVIALIPFFGLLATAALYLVSSHEFTRTNARNALNWYLTASTVTVLTLAVMFGGSVVPVPESVVFVIALPLSLATFVASTLSMIYWLIATGKAIFGTAWQYPFAYEFVSEAN